MQRLSDDRASVLRAAESIRDSVYDTSALQDELEQVQRELAAQAEKLNRAIRTNASAARIEKDRRRYDRKCAKALLRRESSKEDFFSVSP